MRRVEAILAVAMALTLSGCVLRGKPAVATAGMPIAPAPAPPPAPAPKPPANLSETQTQAELPQPQPLTQEAIASAEPPEETPVAPPPRVRSRGGKPSAPAASTRTEPAAPAAAPPTVATAAPPTPVEPDRPLIQEILPPAELNRLQGEATKKRQQTASRLQQLRKRHLGRQEQDQVQQIQSFLKLSEDAQTKSDMRKAWELADKALVLANALSEGR